MHHRISLRVSHRTCPLQAIVDKLALGEPRIGRSVGAERITRDGRVIGFNQFPVEPVKVFQALLNSHWMRMHFTDICKLHSGINQ